MQMTNIRSGVAKNLYPNFYPGYQNLKVKWFADDDFISILKQILSLDLFNFG